MPGSSPGTPNPAVVTTVRTRGGTNRKNALSRACSRDGSHGRRAVDEKLRRENSLEMLQTRGHPHSRGHRWGACCDCIVRSADFDWSENFPSNKSHAASNEKIILYTHTLPHPRFELNQKLSSTKS
eukprot:762639-Hanusia_phi.AAC.15